MIASVNQRWRDQQGSYRPALELIRTSEYEVADLVDDSTPKAFVEQHHYSGSYPAARFRFGLYRHGLLVGTAVFSHPCNDKVITNAFPGAAIQPTEGIELGRFVLLDSVPGNGETWFLGRCFEQLRRKSLFGVVSFSDPMPRQNARGEPVFPGHVGTIYQAFNGRYTGRGTARTLRLLPDGTVFSARTAQKIRSKDRGWEYAVEQLRAFGAPRPGTYENLGSWLRAWLPVITRTVRHPGNHRYVWALAKRDHRHLPKAEPFPKLRLAA